MHLISIVDNLSQAFYRSSFQQKFKDRRQDCEQILNAAFAILVGPLSHGTAERQRGAPSGKVMGVATDVYA
jgi:hypothetical protein